MSKLLIVESPTKVKTIRKYLGNGYEVMASNGHVRDLPKSSLGIDIQRGFRPQYINILSKSKLIKDLKNAAQKSDGVILATDPDREGEAIAWHLAVLLNIPMDQMNRVTFGEITKKGKAGRDFPHPFYLLLIRPFPRPSESSEEEVRRNEETLRHYRCRHRGNHRGRDHKVSGSGRRDHDLFKGKGTSILPPHAEQVAAYVPGA